MVRWAVENEYLDANPLDGMAKPAEATSSNRVLSDDEIRTLWCGLSAALTRSELCQRIIKLCLVTAQRVGEVAGIRRAETRPGRRESGASQEAGPRTATRTSCRSPTWRSGLSKRPWRRPARGSRSFPCGDSSLVAGAVARTILRANEISEERPLGRFGIAPWSAHDLRRTALTGMARLGVAPIVLGHIANHRTTTRAGVTLAVYSQYTYDKEKRAALDLWGERIEGVVLGRKGVVTPISGVLAS